MKTSFLLVPIAALTFSCNSNSNTNKVAAAVVEKVESGELTVTLKEANVELTFEQAALSLDKTTQKDSLYAFDYSVKNYTLQNQTSDATHRHCANSGKGQHIHFIVNNAPYKAKYNTSFEEKLNPGTNVILSFLSRSYHESIKNGQAYNLSVIENKGVKTIDFDKNAPHLFYSRPKGTYKGNDAQKVLVDFYLVNTSLAENGNKVILTVDQDEFIITKWAPYFIEGLDLGEHTFAIKLVDKDNNLIEGPFNKSGNRTITITQ